MIDIPDSWRDDIRQMHDAHAQAANLQAQRVQAQTELEQKTAQLLRTARDVGQALVGRKEANINLLDVRRTWHKKMGVGKGYYSTINNGVKASGWALTRKTVAQESGEGSPRDTPSNHPTTYSIVGLMLATSGEIMHYGGKGQRMDTTFEGVASPVAPHFWASDTLEPRLGKNVDVVKNYLVNFIVEAGLAQG